MLDVEKEVRNTGPKLGPLVATLEGAEKSRKIQSVWKASVTSYRRLAKKVLDETASPEIWRRHLSRDLEYIFQ